MRVVYFSSQMQTAGFLLQPDRRSTPNCLTLTGAFFAGKMTVARGWESKSVESQMEDGHEPQPGRTGAATLEELERTRKREGLESSLRGIKRELESAKSELRRRSLEAALKHLDGEIRKLG